MAHLPSGWPSWTTISRAWPELGEPVDVAAAGSGLRLHTRTGVWYLKRRPLDRVELEVRITDALDRNGVPVTVFQPTGGDLRWLSHRDTAYLIYAALPGSPTGTLRGRPGIGQARALGASAARLHAELSRIDPSGAPPALAAASRQGHVEAAPVQLIHRDFHRGNVLFSGGSVSGRQVSGYLDFDHLAIGPRPLDLAYCAGSVLARRLERGRPEVTDWLRIVAATVTGYAAVSPLTPIERERFADLAVEVQADFLEWFTAIGDRANVELTERMIQLLSDLAPRVTEAVAAA